MGSQKVIRDADQVDAVPSRSEPILIEARACEVFGRSQDFRGELLYPSCGEGPTLERREDGLELVELELELDQHPQTLAGRGHARTRGHIMVASDYQERRGEQPIPILHSRTVRTQRYRFTSMVPASPGHHDGCAVSSRW